MVSCTIMFSSWRKYLTNKHLSLLSLFKPLYVTLAVLGLFPYCVRFKTKHKCVIVPRSIYLNCICAVSVTMLMIVFGGIHIQSMTHEFSGPDIGAMTLVNYFIEVFFLVASCVACYICVYSYRYKIVNILNSMASAWLELPVTRNPILENLRSQILFSLIFLLILLILHVVVNFTRKDGIWKKMLVTMSFLLPQMIQFVALTFYFVLILMVVSLLANIEEVIKTKSKTESISEVETRVNMTSQMTFRSIELVYVKTFEIKREINDAFQATILLTCMQCYHAVVSESHIIYHGIIMARTLTTHEIIHNAIWIVYQLLKIYYLSYSGNLLNMASCKIGRALYNITFDKQDIRSLIEVQHFSSLMSYQATDLTVYGYFSLDASLLFKIIASAAMYLVILVQFDRKN